MYTKEQRIIIMLEKSVNRCHGGKERATRQPQSEFFKF